MHEVELIITTATSPESLSSSSHIPKTARDKFFEDLQREMDKNDVHAIVNGNFKSYVLCFVPLWGSHSSSLLLQNYEAIINTFEIENKYFVQDDLDEINDDDDSDADIEDGETSDEYEYPLDFSSTTATSTQAIDLTLEDLIKESFNRLMEGNEFFRFPCFAHTLQLVVNNGLKEAKTILGAL
ncbi:unnamed protein product [Rotaria magnacalcarata]|uniref:Uncharacterized protein n=4 Tax=Rotaria magnacalcarata TaxID=392030 RepID=A0A815UAP8_9BILA|nr:unnamed protein product [Rotaria magnacalcarata]CAF1938938.1 unnamed protein product [Rotaria magnacalcarata]CAF2156277.1 unnamed protein product [Rotaria magnacalcarata]CAF4296332.1 unnamed protein product [Rotaria magnacalcarata]CAF4301526.1 unnamed protein product [Rotaria magnacalcarata]